MSLPGRLGAALRAALGQRTRSIAAVAICGALLGAFWGLADVPRYESVATVLINDRGEVADEIGGGFVGAPGPEAAARAVELARSERVATEAATLLGDDLSGADLIATTNFGMFAGGEGVRVTSVADSADLAAAAANAFAAALVAVERDAEEQRIEAGSERLRERLDELDPASPEAERVSSSLDSLAELGSLGEPLSTGREGELRVDPVSNRSALGFGLLGGLLGAAVALLIAILAELRHPRRAPRPEPAAIEEEPSAAPEEQPEPEPGTEVAPHAVGDEPAAEPSRRRARRPGRRSRRPGGIRRRRPPATPVAASDATPASAELDPAPAPAPVPGPPPEVVPLATLPSLGRARSGLRLGAGGAISLLPALRAAVGELAGSLDLGRPGASGPKTIAVSSVARVEGRSTISLALAALLAERGAQVLLVETDFSNPSLALRLRAEPAPGLAQYLSGDASPREVMRPVPITSRRSRAVADSEAAAPALVCVPAGRVAGVRPGLLSGSRFTELVDRLQRAYDVVIFDAAPLEGTGAAGRLRGRRARSPVRDGAAVAAAVEVAVLCVDAGDSVSTALRRAAESEPGLRLAGAVVISR